MSEIVTYADLMEMPTGETRQTLAEMIRAMDGAYLALMRETRDV